MLLHGSIFVYENVFIKIMRLILMHCQCKKFYTVMQSHIHILLFFILNIDCVKLVYTVSASKLISKIIPYFVIFFHHSLISDKWNLFLILKKWNFIFLFRVFFSKPSQFEMSIIIILFHYLSDKCHSLFSI